MEISGKYRSRSWLGNKASGKMSRLLCCFSVFLMLCLSALPGKTGVSFAAKASPLQATLYPTRATIGDIVGLRLRHPLLKNRKTLQHADLSGLEGLDIVDREGEPGGIRVRFLADREGLWRIGPVALTSILESGKSVVLSSRPVTLQVRFHPVESPAESGLKPMKGILPRKQLSHPLLRRWLWVPVGLTLVFLGLFIVRNKRESSTADESGNTLYSRTRAQMDALESMGLFESGEIKAFYIRFSKIIRKYLAELHGFSPDALTTEEIYTRVAYEKDKNLLILLKEADLAKFAGVVPTSPQKEEAVKKFRNHLPADGASPHH